MSWNILRQKGMSRFLFWVTIYSGFKDVLDFTEQFKNLAEVGSGKHSFPLSYSFFLVLIGMLMKFAMLIIRLKSWAGLCLKITVFVQTGILIHLFAVIHQFNLNASNFTLC